MLRNKIRSFSLILIISIYLSPSSFAGYVYTYDYAEGFSSPAQRKVKINFEKPDEFSKSELFESHTPPATFDTLKWDADPNNLARDILVNERIKSIHIFGIQGPGQFEYATTLIKAVSEGVAKEYADFEYTLSASDERFSNKIRKAEEKIRRAQIKIKDAEYGIVAWEKYVQEWKRP